MMKEKDEKGVSLFSNQPRYYGGVKMKDICYQLVSKKKE